MTHYKLALLGFGNVGQAFAQLLTRKKETIKNQYGISYAITGIATGSHGVALNPAGIDTDTALALMAEGNSLDSLSSQPAPKNNLDFIQTCDADVLFENTPVSYHDGQPALDHIRQALNKGMYAITANKGPVVHGFQELSALAAQKGKKFYFESTVMDGAPIFSMFRELPAAQLTKITGVLNSTTNLMLSRMEDGESFDQAVAHAQAVGIAETDPSGDVDGWDAAIKLAALVSVLMGISLKPDQIKRSGIRDITPAQIAEAKSQG
ncbi:MAG: homoserine dehydrogenase, partial [Chloroflexota bacterium]